MRSCIDVRDDECDVDNDGGDDDDGGAEYVLNDDDDDEGDDDDDHDVRLWKAGILFTIKFSSLSLRRCNAKSHS